MPVHVAARVGSLHEIVFRCAPCPGCMRAVPAQTPSNGFCSLDGKPIHCFLFARKFHPSTLPVLLQHSQEWLGY